MEEPGGTYPLFAASVAVVACAEELPGAVALEPREGVLQAATAAVVELEALGAPSPREVPIGAPVPMVEVGAGNSPPPGSLVRPLAQSPEHHGGRGRGDA